MMPIASMSAYMVADPTKAIPRRRSSSDGAIDSAEVVGISAKVRGLVALSGRNDHTSAPVSGARY